MALVVADRVLETTNTTGTGTLTLAGAVAGYQSFSVIGNGNTTYYTIVSGTAWETGIGTYTSVGTTLARTTILASSNAGAAITVAAGANVYCDYVASRAVYRDASNILTLPAGTTTVPPLDFTAGTNLTTPIAGAMEYDGKVAYFTPQGTQRGVIPGAQFYALNAGLTGLSATGNQSMFGVGCTLSSSTIYRFEILWMPSKSAGTTSHTISIGFGGTATVNWIAWDANWNGATTYNVSNSGGYYTGGTQTTPFAITNARTSASDASVFHINGNVSINAGGTFIPQYALSAAPGGAYTGSAGSYILIYPIGTAGSNVNVGTWA
jgi:hypothetical protein